MIAPRDVQEDREDRDARTVRSHRTVYQRAIRTLSSHIRRPSTPLLIGSAAVIAAAALLLRATLFPYRSGDYMAYVSQWYAFISQHGGFRALRYNFANYNEPYLYLIALLTYVPLPAIDAVKLLSVCFDFLLAFFTYRIVALRHRNPCLPLLAATIVVFLPTVVLNGSMWGQADAIYAALGLGGLYYALRRRPWLACVFFGLAFSFKLQIVFIFPVLLLLLLGRRLPWPALLLIPAVYVATDLPAILLGANPRELLSVYLTQANTYQQLTLNAPNLYQFLGGAGDVAALRAAGIVLTAALVLLLIAGAVRSRVELTLTRIVLAAAVSVVLLPYLLPAMHERYFYLADAMTVIAAFYLPGRLWFLPPIEQFASALSYVPFLSMAARGMGAGLDRHGGGRLAGRGSGGGRPPVFGGRGGSMPHPGQMTHLALSAAPRLTASSWVSFELLALAMLVVLAVLLWTAVREFRRPPGVPAPG